MRVENGATSNFLSIQLGNIGRSRTTTGAVSQLIDLAVQKNTVRADNDITEAVRQAKLVKLEKLSDPINQKLEADQEKLTTEELVEASKQAEKEIREAVKRDEDDSIDPTDEANATTVVDDSFSTAPSSSISMASASEGSSESSLGQNVDVYV